MIFYELGGFQTIPNSLYLGTEDILFLMSMMLLVAQGTVGLRAPPICLHMHTDQKLIKELQTTVQKLLLFLLPQYIQVQASSMAA
jgi:hypothetical protein